MALSIQPTVIKITRNEHGFADGPVGAHSSAEIQATVSSPYGSANCLSTASLLQCTTEEIHKEIEWYYEKYPLADAFDRPRADAVEAILQKHGCALLSSFITDQILPKDKRTGSLVLQINSGSDSNDTSVVKSFSRCLWESLENPNVWLEALEFLPDRITVVRTHGSTDNQQRETADLAKNYTKLLVTTARLSTLQEIPHRLISRAIHDVVYRIPNYQSQSQDDFRIVRPGTFSALRETLHQHVRGYFDILHLDVHGYVDANGHAWLSFAKISRNLDLEADPVGAKELVNLLQESGVRIVVLNACQSSANKGASSNIAEQLINAGIDIVIGMQYDVMSRSAELFIRYLYEALLLHHKPIFESVTLARAQLRTHSLRRTRFGHNVSLKDYTVPTIHCSEAVFERSLQKPHFNEQGLAASLYAASDPPKSGVSMIGRELDMLCLETLMIQLPKVCFNITGPIGIGKTAFLDDVGKWWRETGFTVHELSFGITGLCSLLGDTRSLGDLLESKIKQTRSACPAQQPSTGICNHRLLVVLDDLDSLDWNSPRSSAHIQKQLRVLIRRLENTLWIFSSRTPLNWLNSVAVCHELRPLTLAESLGIASQSDTFVGESSRMFSAVAGREYFEELILSCDGNPLAVRIMMGHVNHYFKRNSNASMASLFNSFLKTEYFHIDKKDVLQWTNSQSVRNLWTSLDYLKAKSELRDSDQIKRRLDRELTRSASNGANDLGRWQLSDGYTLILSLGTFCSTTPYNLLPFLTALSLQPILKSINGLAFTKIVRKAVFEAIEDFGLSQKTFYRLLRDKLWTVEVPSFVRRLPDQGWESRRWVETVIATELAPWFGGPKELVLRSPQGSFTHRYRVIHPVLTLILRASLSLHQELSSLREQIQWAVAVSYRLQLRELEHAPSDPLNDLRAIWLLIGNDFINYLSHAVSTNRTDSWPAFTDWANYNLLYLSSQGEPRREKLIAIFSTEFTKYMTPYVQSARKEYFGSIGEVNRSPKGILHSWEDIAGLELTCVNCLLYALAYHEKYFLPMTGLGDVLEILQEKSVILDLSSEDDVDMKPLFTLRLATCQGFWRSIDGSSEAKPMDFLKSFDDEIEALRQSGIDVESLIKDSNANGNANRAPIDRLRQVLNPGPDSSFLAQPFEAELLNAQPLGTEWTQEDTLVSISKFEALLEKEVQISNDPLRKVALYHMLALFNTLVGNFSVAADHHRRRAEILSTLGQDAVLLWQRKEQRWRDFMKTVSIHEGVAAELSSEEKARQHLTGLFEKLNNLQIQEGHSHDDEIAMKDEIAIHLRVMHQDLRAMSFYEEVIQFRKTKYGLEDFRFLEAAGELARCYSDVGRYDESIRRFKELLPSVVRLSESKPEDSKFSNCLCVTHSALGVAQLQLSKQSISAMKSDLLLEAEQNFKIVEQHSRKLAPTRETIDALAAALTNLAFIQDARNNCAAAVELQTESLSLWESLTTDRSDESILRQQHSLAYFLGKAGKFRLAEQTFRSVIDRQVEKLGSGHHDTVGAIQSFGIFLEKHNKRDEAQALAKKYLLQLLGNGKLLVTVEKRCFTFDHIPLGALGQDHLFDVSISPTAEAVELWSTEVKQRKDELEMCQRLHGPVSPFTQSSAMMLIGVLWRSGDCEGALNEHNKLCQLLESHQNSKGVVYAKNDFWRHKTSFCLPEGAETEAMEICTRARVLGIPELPVYLSQYAEVLERFKQPGKALIFRQKFYEYNVTRYGPETSDGLQSFLDYAWAVGQAVNTGAAINMIQRFIAGDSIALSKVPNVHANAYRFIGMMLLQEGERPEGLAQYEEACNIWRSTGTKTVLRVSTLRAMSESYRALNMKDAEYLRCLVDEEVEIARVALGVDHPMTQEALSRQLKYAQ